MKQITINPNSKPYYSEDFIKGFKCGVQRQFEADKADRPQGEWEKDNRGTFICSNCGSGYKEQPTLMGKPMFEYCPICGAHMKGADDEV